MENEVFLSERLSLAENFTGKVPSRYDRTSVKSACFPRSHFDINLLFQANNCLKHY